MPRRETPPDSSLLLTVFWPLIRGTMMSRAYPSIATCGCGRFLNVSFSEDTFTLHPSYCLQSVGASTFQIHREKMAWALLLSLKPPVLMKGNTMSRRGQNVPKRHTNPGPGTQVDLKLKSLYWATG